MLNPMHTLDDPSDRPPFFVVILWCPIESHRGFVLRLEGFERATAGVPSSLAMLRLHLMRSVTTSKCQSWTGCSHHFWILEMKFKC